MCLVVQSIFKQQVARWNGNHSQLIANQTHGEQNNIKSAARSPPQKHNKDINIEDILLPSVVAVTAHQYGVGQRHWQSTSG